MASHWALRACLLAVIATLAVACGGDDTRKGPVIPVFDVDSVEQGQASPTAPAVEIANAPTDSHRKLAGFLPATSELVGESLRYGGWDSVNADLSAEEAVRAAMPVVGARYSSKGFDELTGAEGQRPKRHDFPQMCELFIIQAPDELAAAVIERDIRARLVNRGLALRDPVAMPVGMVDGEVIDLEVACYVQTQPGADNDTVLTGYVAAFGDVVMYALERQSQPVIKNEDGTRIDELSGRRGPHYGARLIFLAHSRMGD